MTTRSRSPKTLRRNIAFTLVEMLISISVLALLVLLVTKMLNNASVVAIAGNKHMDADSQARSVFDRMAIDFSQMLRRADVDYFLKQPDSIKYPGHSGEHGHGSGTKGDDQSDQIAFFSQVPGYYPDPTAGLQSPLSLVAYRVNANPNQPTFNRLERMAKGLLWNGVKNATNPNANGTVYPIVFLPQTISSMGKPWYAAVNNNSNTSSQDPDYETIGPQVFRFEYYYLLKNGDLTDTPWDTTTSPPHSSVNGLVDLEAIVVAIAVIDPRSRSLLSDQNIVDLAAQMNDFKTQNGNGPVKSGVIEDQWNTVVLTNVNSGAIPREAASAIRIYSRYFSLNLL